MAKVNRISGGRWAFYGKIAVHYKTGSKHHANYIYGTRIQINLLKFHSFPFAEKSSMFSSRRVICGGTSVSIVVYGFE